MRLLLDTNVFLWAQLEPNRLGESLRHLEDDDSDVLVSAVTAWEIAIKYERGKLGLPKPPAAYVPESIWSIGARPIIIDHADVLAAADLPDLHRDPFDRLLVAQAVVRDAALVTSDRRLAGYPASTILVR